jgi:hypothetical protein
VDHIVIGGGMSNARIVSTVMDRTRLKLLSLDREASLGLRSHAHFYSAFQTGRRYS